MEVGITAIGWYREEDWEELRKLFVDSDKLSPTYAGWLETAEKGERTLKEKGHRVVRAEIRPKEFAEWCKDRALTTDARARGQFGSWYAHQVAIGKIKQGFSP
jgi:hypothetical protein